MYYYPEILPDIDVEKVKRVCENRHDITRLYSDEGIFQIKNAKIKRLHFEDDENYGKKITIGSNKFICDKTKVDFIPTNKIPYSFEKREFTLYNKGRMGVEYDSKQMKITHLYFNVESPDIFGIEEEIAEYMKKICGKI